MKAVIKHTLVVYETLEKASSIEVIEGQEISIYRGKVSKLFSTLGIGMSYYTEIFDQLDRQGCVTFLQRGGRSVDTVIVLHYPPSPEGWQERPRRTEDLTTPEKYANLVERVELHHKLLGGIDIAEALIAIDMRLKSLEGNKIPTTKTQGEN